jgi:deoxyribodipyrimidine photo-lyase
MLAPMASDDARVRRVNERPESARGDYVLYWMQIARRLDHNHALDHAMAQARRLGRPLVVYEGLQLDYPWASVRLHRFILEGMQANSDAAEALGLTYWPWVERRPGEGRGLLAGLAARAALVVTDDFPCFIVPAQTDALAARAPVAVIAVDTSTVVPLSRLGATVSAAAHLRPRIHRAFAEAWEHRAAGRPRVPAVAARAVAPSFEPAALRDLDALIDTLPVDRSVPPVAATPGGGPAARRRLADFIAHRLRGTAERRPHPAPPDRGHQSGLSPYLHFGHIAIEEVVERVLASTGDWTPAALNPGAVGRREDFFCRDPDVNSFLDEALTWRDLGLHWHRARRADTARLETALPAWARATLGAHAVDRRAHTYSREEWEAAATHDPLWNAAQRELSATGTIHNYLRMLWGKKVLEWSRTPDEAYATLVHLNNKYALDGRDPNSYTGILWCFGLFDRPWAPERRVLGTVRYMSSENTARKFKLGPYLDYVASLPAPPPRGSGAGERAGPARPRASAPPARRPRAAPPTPR